MPTFCYTIQHGSVANATVEVELPNTDEAWSQAVITCGQSLAELNGNFGRDDEWLLSVSDATGIPLFEIRCTGKHFARG